MLHIQPTHHVRLTLLALLLLLLTPLLAVVRPQPVIAVGVVSECTEAALRVALEGGGLVTFSCSGTIPIASQIEITEDTVIDGGGQVTLDGGSVTRLFVVFFESSLDLRGLTLSNGFAEASGGGAIVNFGSLLIEASTLSGNTAEFPGGGAILNQGSDLTIAASTLSGNSANFGGALVNEGADVTITGSTLSGNTAQAGGAIVNIGVLRIVASMLAGNSALLGGAIDNRGDLTLAASTLDDNDGENGGALLNAGEGTALIVASTLVNNRATDVGGAVDNFGVLTLTTSTLSGNSAANGGETIFNRGVLPLTANILSGSNLCGGPSAVVSGGYNVSSDATCNLTAPGDLQNANPLLGPLMNNGGPTLTMRPLTGSPAIDRVPNAICATLSAANESRDQRGAPRPAGSAPCDSGAVELQLNSVVVSECTEAALRAALAGGGLVTFSCSGTIPIASQIEITVDTAIDGGGQVTLDGGGATRLFSVAGGVALELIGLTLSGGFVAGAGVSGGAIDNAGTLTIRSSTLTGNSVELGFGGAIRNDGTLTIIASTLHINTASGGGAISNRGTLTIIASTLTNNFATNGGAISSSGSLAITASTLASNGGTSGGAIFNTGGATITASTLTGNRTSFQGGAIFNSGGLTMVASTLTGNTALMDGGAFYNSGPLTLTASTLQGNTGSAAIYNVRATPVLNGSVTLTANILSNSVPNCATNEPAITSNGYNVGNDASCGLTNTGDVQNTDPQLGDLQDNGGSTLTMLPAPTSPAIGRVPNALCASLSAANDGRDQRGALRPVGAANCTSGSVETGAVVGARLLAAYANPDTIDEGQSTTLYAVGSGPAGATLQYTFACPTGDVGPQASASASCSFPIPGEIAVPVSVSAVGVAGSDSATVLVTVRDLAPLVTLEPASVIIVEGGSYQGEGAFTSATIGPWTATVDYGDGADPQDLGAVTPGMAIPISHQYLSIGDYTITLEVCDSGLERCRIAQAGVTVNAAEIVVALDPGAVTIAEGGSYIGIGTFSSTSPGPFTAMVDYDGRGPNDLGEVTSGVDIPISHQYLDAGRYSLRLEICDTLVGRCSTAQASVTVTEVQIAVTLDPASATIAQGDSYTGSGTFNSDGQGPFRADVFFDDGSLPESLGMFTPGQAIPISHQFLNAGQYTIRLEICDTLIVGRCGEALVNVTVTEAQIVVTVEPDSATIDEGQSFEAIGSFTSNTPGPFTATVFYGDFSVPQELGEFAPGEDIPISHQYFGGGQRTLRLQICDATIFRCGEGQATITVNALAPIVSIEPVSLELVQGETFQASGSFSDVGLGSWSATVSWGDEVGQRALPLNDDRTFNLSHVYLTPGEFEVTVRVCDVFACGQASVTVQVAEAQLAVTLGPPTTTITEGGSFLGTGLFSVSGPGQWTATIDYGDGSDPDERSDLQPEVDIFIRHQYVNAGDYTITLEVCNTAISLCSEAEVTVTVTAAQVTAALDPATDTFGEGGSYEGSALFTSDGPGPWTATVDYGDGSTPQVLDNVTPMTPIPISHAYLLAGDYTLTLEICDTTVNRCGDATAEITATAVAPSVTIIPVSLQIVQGDTFQASGSFTDPGLGPWTATVDYGQGAGPEPLPLAPNQTFNLSRQYLQQGSFLVTVVVCDATGACGSETVRVEVVNVAPVIEEVRVRAEGSQVIVDVVAGDPGGAELSYRIMCAGTVIGPQASPEAVCSYPNQTGQFVILVEVIDTNQVITDRTVVVEILTYLCVGERSGTPRLLDSPGGCVRGEQPLVLTSVGSWAFCVGERSGSLRYLFNGNDACLRGEWKLTLPEQGPITVCVGERSRSMRYVANAGQCSPRGEVPFIIANRVS